MTSRVRVMAGACGFTSVVRVSRVDKKHVSVKIISACKMLRKMNEDLALLDWRKDLFCNISNSIIYRSANKHLMHTDCPVPCAIVKVIQIELEGMVPTNVCMQFERIGKEDEM
ncbi:DUF6951 family protein [Candidatus Contubernalis alkaliaceticus]|uniref:DUF6951 family protein n=1 Tax=Candidatus Contubernalis alkaliaceticus TaxID=338645 RepID=UPI001F4C1495|nr:hypothetical protein [Candidatus Contubernalis alkalaceticus]UNC91588.1 hypothetical protein HUE98_05490 [Candidatus Contubernalis alkalaceticus]